MATLTIVITNYNHGPYLGAAIDSVLLQSRPPDRILVIDDGSTDNSADILATVPKHIDIIRQANRGVVAARNRALETIKTSHVAFLDADDMLLPWFCRWHMAAWRLRTHGLALTYSPYRCIEISGATGYEHSSPWDPQRLYRKNYIANTSVFNATLLKSLGGYSDRYAVLGHEDWDLLLRLADNGWHGRMVPRPTFVVRRLPQSRNGTSMARRDELEKAIHEDHPARPHRPHYLHLHRKITNPIQSTLRVWDELITGFDSTCVCNRSTKS